MSVTRRNDLLIIYVDGDACPVKNEVFRVAGRHQLLTRVVCNSWFRLPASPLIEQFVVAEGLDAADDWIVEHAWVGDIVITADIQLAARCLEKKTKVLRPNGKFFSEQNIGSAIAMRDLMADLRDRGEIDGTNRPFTKQDRIQFLDALESAVRSMQRDANKGRTI